MIILSHNYFSRILTKCAKSSIFRLFASLLLTISLVAIISTAGLQAAVVDGDGIERTVDTPQGEIVTKSLEPPKELKTNNSSTVDTSLDNNDSDFQADTLPNEEPSQPEEVAPSGAPDAPVFDPNVNNTGTEKSGGWGKFLAVAALVVIIGLVAIFAISRYQGRDD